MLKKLSIVGATIIAVSIIGIIPLLPIGIKASALTINTSDSWDGNVNEEWSGSGQSLTVDRVENVFDSFSFYVDEASNGRTFNFILSNALNGGDILFSQSMIVATGLNTININQAMAPDSEIYALLDYNGFIGKTVHYIASDVYSGGNSSFDEIMGDRIGFDSLDHRFIAKFSAASPKPVPEPMTIFGILTAGVFSAVLKLKQQKNQNKEPNID